MVPVSSKAGIHTNQHRTRKSRDWYTGTSHIHKSTTHHRYTQHQPRTSTNIHNKQAQVREEGKAPSQQNTQAHMHICTYTRQNSTPEQRRAARQRASKTQQGQAAQKLNKHSSAPSKTALRLVGKINNPTSHQIGKVLRLTRLELAPRRTAKRPSESRAPEETSQAPYQHQPSTRTTPANRRTRTGVPEQARNNGKRGIEGFSQHMSENPEPSSRERERGAYIPGKERKTTRYRTVPSRWRGHLASPTH